jgi:hypothetical protein
MHHLALSGGFCCEDFDEVLGGLAQQVPDFVEGIIYSEREAVMTTGRYASAGEAGRKGNVVNPLGRWYKPWFHLHAQTALTRGTFTEYVPIRQYYHRHTRSLYWEGGLIVPMGNHPLFRFFLGWLMPPKVTTPTTHPHPFKRKRERESPINKQIGFGCRLVF